MFRHVPTQSAQPPCPTQSAALLWLVLRSQRDGLPRVPDIPPCGTTLAPPVLVVLKPIIPFGNGHHCETRRCAVMIAIANRDRCESRGVSLFNRHIHRVYPSDMPKAIIRINKGGARRICQDLRCRLRVNLAVKDAAHIAGQSASPMRKTPRSSVSTCIPATASRICLRNASTLIKGACKLAKRFRFNSDFIVLLIVCFVQFSSHLNRTTAFAAYGLPSCNPS